MEANNPRDFARVVQEATKEQKNIKIFVDPITMTMKVEYLDEGNKKIEENPRTEITIPKSSRKKKVKAEDNGVTEYGMKKIFSKYKGDEFATITNEELFGVFDEMGYEVDNDTIEKLKVLSDADGDGEMNLQEFTNLLLYVFLKDNHTEDEIIEAFKQFDYADSDFLPVEVTRQVLTNLGDKFTENEINALVDMGDLDGDGNINYYELTRKIFKKKEAFDETNRL